MRTFSHTHAVRFRAAFGILAFLLSIPTLAAGQAHLEWELVVPFRFIRKSPPMDELKRVYESLNQKSAEALERELQEVSERDVKQRRITDLQTCLAEGKQVRDGDCEERTHYPFSGWFSKLAFRDYDALCWDARDLKFRDEERCRPDRTPTTYRIRAWLPGATGAPAGVRWINNGEMIKGDACTLDRSSVCAEFDLDTTSKPQLSSVDQTGRVVAVSEAIEVKEKLVVGLGDSYASGEGNPDIPAQFMRARNRSDVDFAYFWKWRRLVRKDDTDPSYRPLNQGRSDVEWLDARCHRSMYSYQFKTALLLALSHPKEALTFVSYACSGGVTDNIVDTFQKPNEKMRGVDNKITPQLEALRRAVGTRPIDYVLLSTGGNDLKFSKYVTNIVTSGRTRLFLKLIGGALRATDDRTRRSLADLANNYARLQQALFDPKSGIKIKTCNGQPCPSRVLLTAYPPMFTNEKDDPCEINRDEFTLPFNKDRRRMDRMIEVRDKLANALWEFQKNVSTGWTLAESHRAKYAGHGFCAQNGTNDIPLSIDENFMMVRRRDHRWWALDWRDAKDDPHFYDPRDYRPYDPNRARWIRLPVDSKMTSDQQDRFLNWFSYDFLFMDDRSSVMHPTALAHAVHADANLAAIAALDLQ